MTGEEQENIFQAGMETIKEDIADILDEYKDYRRYAPVREIADAIGYKWGSE